MSSLDSFVLDDWMWIFLITHSAVHRENRGSRTGSQGSPFMSNGEMNNAVLVDTALSWLLDNDVIARPQPRYYKNPIFDLWK